ncbi:MAG: glutathione S-transferase family protein [Candidatus Macondimonas sp.]|jgi:glutathione S-transferase
MNQTSGYPEETMIQFYQLKRTWGIPNLCHFCCKTETYLRMAALPYEVNATLPLMAPKGKLPYIVDGSARMGDSRFIVRYLKKTYGDHLDQQLSTAQIGAGRAMQRLLEEHLYWVTMFTRWDWTRENWETNKTAIFSGMPVLIRDVAAYHTRRGIRKQLWGHGTRRHKPEEIFELGFEDIDAVSNFLENKPYLLGETPTSFDATGYGFLVNTLACPIESPVKNYALTKKNLVDYVNRMQTRYYTDLVAA